jgi:hypothetical protein
MRDILERGDWDAIGRGNVGFVYVGALMRSCFLLAKRVKGQITMSENKTEKLLRGPRPKYVKGLHASTHSFTS